MAMFSKLIVLESITRNIARWSSALLPPTIGVPDLNVEPLPCKISPLLLLSSTVPSIR